MATAVLPLQLARGSEAMRMKQTTVAARHGSFISPLT